LIFINLISLLIGYFYDFLINQLVSSNWLITSNCLSMFLSLLAVRLVIISVSRRWEWWQWRRIDSNTCSGY